MLSIISCQTTKIVYVVPDIDIPNNYPNPAGKTFYDTKTDEVRMSLDYYQKIMEYKLKVDEARKDYLKAKEIYESKEG